MLNENDIIVLKDINNRRHIDMLVYNILSNIYVYSILISILEKKQLEYILKSKGFLSIDVDRNNDINSLINFIIKINRNNNLIYIVTYFC